MRQDISIPDWRHLTVFFFFFKKKEDSERPGYLYFHRHEVDKGVRSANPEQVP